MSDVVSAGASNETNAASEVAAGAAVSVEAARGFGAQLAAEREKQGLALTDIAARLRFHPRQILALEQEDLAALPAAPFLRGFLRNYARELKLDSKPLLEALDAKLGVAAHAGPQITADVEKTLIKSSMRPPTIETLAPERASRTTVVAGVVGALVVLTVIGFVASNRAQRAPVNAQGQADIAAKKDEMPAAAAANADTPVVLPAQSEPAEAQGAPSPAADAAPAMPEAVAASTPGPAAAVAPAAASATPNQPPAAATGLHLKFEESAWVEVTQGDGKLLLSQVNEAGTEKVLIGTPPLRAVIGNASRVVVEYRGRAVDLKPVTSADNVARITLK